MRKVPRARLGRRHSVGISCMVAVLFAIGIWILLPKAFYAGALLTAQDDPVALADIQLVKSGFDSQAAEREIEQALAAGDADLANSFLQLARDRGVAVTATLSARVDAAVQAANSVTA